MRERKWFHGFGEDFGCFIALMVCLPLIIMHLVPVLGFPPFAKAIAIALMALIYFALLFRTIFNRPNMIHTSNASAISYLGESPKGKKIQPIDWMISEIAEYYKGVEEQRSSYVGQITPYDPRIFNTKSVSDTGTSIHDYSYAQDGIASRRLTMFMDRKVLDIVKKYSVPISMQAGFILINLLFVAFPAILSSIVLNIVSRHHDHYEYLFKAAVLVPMLYLPALLTLSLAATESDTLKKAIWKLTAGLLAILNVGVLLFFLGLATDFPLNLIAIGGYGLVLVLYYHARNIMAQKEHLVVADSILNSEVLFSVLVEMNYLCIENEKGEIVCGAMNDKICLKF